VKLGHLLRAGARSAIGRSHGRRKGCGGNSPKMKEKIAGTAIAHLAFTRRSARPGVCGGVCMSPVVRRRFGSIAALG